MQERWFYRESMTQRVRTLVDKPLAALLPVRKVTVLLLLLAGAVAARAQAPNEREQQAFEFTSDVSTPMGLSRLKGVMTTDGIRHRMAIYWIEPRLVRNSTHLLNACDLLFAEDAVHYWLPGMTQPGTLRACDVACEPLLPRQNDLPSVVRSALAIVCNVRCDPGSEAANLNLQDFLRQSRTAEEYRCEFLPADGDETDLFSDTITDVQILNALPLGRKYTKDVFDDGSLRWQLKEALTDRFIIGALIRPMNQGEDGVDARPFDPETLGQWKSVPQPYRDYWQLRAATSDLEAAAHPETQARVLCDRIESWLHTCEAPSHVRRAMEYLWVESAFTTHDLDRIDQALCAMATGLCHDDTLNPRHVFLEMAEVSGKMQSEYPQQFRAIWEPLLQQMVEQTGDGIVESLDRLIPAIQANRRFSYGEILFETIRRQPWAQSPTVERLLARYEATRLATQTEPFDQTAASAAVKQYLAQSEIGPLCGGLSMQDVRTILEQGLSLPDDDATDNKVALVDEVLDLLHPFIGGGPFHGDPPRLTDSVRRFSQTYYVVCKNAEPIQSALATFLALSFCDTSAPEEHQVLRAQYHSLAADLESQVNALLTRYKLTALVGPNDVAQTFAEQEAVFHSYVDDPLWPTFKFPWTANERTRLAAKLKLRLAQAEPLLDEMSDKVRYGGVDDRLKQRTLQELAWVFQHLMVEAAFQRRPPYPGITTQHRGRHGFSAVIQAPFYQQRPKERFRAMKYFHLGHRLEHLVRAERDVARVDQQRDEEPDTP